MADEVTHQVVTGSGLTRCCRKTLFELPPDDRVSMNSSKVTCAAEPK